MKVNGDLKGAIHRLIEDVQIFCQFSRPRKCPNLCFILAPENDNLFYIYVECYNYIGCTITDNL